MDERVVQTLHDELEAARRRRDTASERFDNVIRGIPSGISYRDGSDGISRASRGYSRALREVTDAHRRLNEYVQYGTVPVDLHLVPEG
jgi:hypothetical protein